MIQVALDRLTKEECISITEQTYNHIDYIEIGTGVIKEYGMDIIREFRHRFPYKKIVADMKTCDAGKDETVQALEAGADITTVMGFAHDQTILDSIKIAKELNKRVLVDLLEVPVERFQRLKELGVELVSAHIGKDTQVQAERYSLERYKSLSDDFTVFVAGGISPESVQRFEKLKPDVFIVGGYITSAANPGKASATIKEVIPKT
ncbi:3-hexulose-6-phosphate synthase [Salinibacillus xinjiangensis]|uniref:3-hexulose-6-phosphate synthase n=1 Tax=Salinibacillus xinjiangensis TaxID=1229268 RepID=A0A6G1X201_9BACI|nr:3-hexulose-6-phosphate synthase [Salinibacillus xinjiangensis]MRG84964.1 Fe-S cluster assembly protein HesB [Salinibacillus xinjiangensis]